MSQPGTTTRPPIAVVGVSALFPGSSDVTGFWRDILAGTDRMTPVPPTHWLVDDYFDADPAAIDKTSGRRGGFHAAHLRQVMQRCHVRCLRRCIRRDHLRPGQLLGFGRPQRGRNQQ